MKTPLALALLALCTFAAQEVAQEAAPPSKQSEQHVWLEQLVGDWKVSTEVIMEPDAEATTWRAQESIRSVGGLWIVSEGTATYDGEPYTSLMTLGYDPNKKAFVGTWVDTMLPTMWSYEGQLDESGRILTLEAEGPSNDDPSKTAKYRDQIELVGPNHKRTTSSMLGEDGTWTSFMTMDAHRVRMRARKPAKAGGQQGATPDQLAVVESDIHYLEVVTPDVKAARDFYSGAYGWWFDDAAPELGNAVVALLPNGSMCGIRAPMSAQEKPTVRTYIRVADVVQATEQAAKLGATIALGPTELPGRGWIAIYLIGGIEQGIWQVP